MSDVTQVASSSVTSIRAWRRCCIIGAFEASTHDWAADVVKIAADIALFVASYLVQKKLIFRR